MVHPSRRREREGALVGGFRCPGGQIPGGAVGVRGRGGRCPEWQGELRAGDLRKERPWPPCPSTPRERTCTCDICHLAASTPANLAARWEHKLGTPAPDVVAPGPLT
ncbi:hypothetical protein GCM10009616_29010 [Microlunatus lacustris]